MIKKLCLTAALLLCTSGANAAIYGFIDNGTYTTDTFSGLDWLDITESKFRSYNDVSTQFGIGGDFEGWRYATSAEVTEYWDHAGGTSPYLGSVGGQAPWITDLLALWGITVDDTPEFDITFAIIDDVPSAGSHWLSSLLDHPSGALPDDHASLFHQIWFDNDIGANGSALVRQSADPPVIPVPTPITIDIKPGSDPNAINPKSKGVVPVAILGSTDFDATQVDFSTVTFGPDGASPAHDGHVEYVNDDGFMDMVFHFKTQETGIVCGDTEATLIGDTFDGTPITGSDSLTTVGCSKKDDEGPSLTFTPDEWTLTLDTGGPGIHSIFMIADVSPLAVNDVQDLGGKLIWDETQIELCADPTYPPEQWGEFISIREVGNGFLKIGDGFQTSSDDCTINTTMQMAFDEFGLPNEACLSVRTGGVDFEYCAPLAVSTTPTLLGLSMMVTLE